MCGIYGYTGNREAAPLLLKGLHALEYRGYDSAGIFIFPSGVVKAKGEVSALEKKVPKRLKGNAGIAHTRWATHGAPNNINAHPHAGNTGRVFLVHNGIIENYRELRARLEKKGNTFVSATDSEVLAHLIEDILVRGAAKNLEAAVIAALREVQGTYGIAVMDTEEPEKIVTARLGSPIALGIGKGEYFVSSDPSALLEHTRDVVYLNDGDVSVLTPGGYFVLVRGKKTNGRAPEYLDWDADQVQKEGYEHFMLKEIMEAPEVLVNSARGRIDTKTGTVKLGGLEEVKTRLKDIKHVVIVGCGTAYYAGLVGKYLFMELAKLPATVEVASEFRYQHTPLSKDTVVIAISQSGETADTLAAVREAKKHGCLSLGVVNAIGSTIARETDAGVYNHAGAEIGVASTKAFLSQLEVLALLALSFSEKTLSFGERRRFARAIAALPGQAEKILKQKNAIRKLAKKYASARDFLFIGRNYQYPIALEGALKLKEISYVHAEGYSAGEMKHGPLAMIDGSFPTVALVPRSATYGKTVSNIEEIKARKGQVIAIASEGDTRIAHIADAVFYIPKAPEALAPILTAIPLQLFAYYMGVLKGYNVDKPRNLAKSVTVE